MRIDKRIGDVLFLFSIPIRLLWMILYIVAKICFLCIVNFGAIALALSFPFRMIGKCCSLPLKLYRKPKMVEETLPVLATLESIPPPTCSACCNTTCCNNFAMRMRHARQFMGTRTFLIYVLAVGHGIGVSMHELCNKALDSYIYKELQGGNSATGKPYDANTAIRGSLISINLTFFFISQLIIITIFSLLKFFIRSRTFFAETFYLLSILFFVLQLPILPLFGVFTNEDPDDGSNTRKNNQGSSSTPVTTIPAEKVLCLILFHGTILFWMFSGGPLTFYISTAILGGDTGIMSFGVLVVNMSLVGASWLFMAITTLDTTNGYKAFIDDTQRIVVPVFIAGEFLIFLLFFKHDWWWNKGNWFNYLLLIITGMVNSIFVTYANIMLADVVKTGKGQDYKWIVVGAFYSGTNVIISIGMFFMFRSLGYDVQLINIACKCIKINIRYNFATVYMTITFVFILLDVGAAGIYFKA